MGDIRKQGVSNSFILYLGVALGYINVVLLFPKFFTPDQFGLTRLLLSFGNIMATLSHVGFNNVTIKYFPYFKDDSKSHANFLFLILFVPLLGFILIALLFFALKPWIINQFAPNSPLFVKHLYWVFPLTLFQIYFNAFTAYARSLFQAVLPMLFKEIGVRLIVMISILLATFQVINFQAFLYLFALAYASPVIGFLVYFLSNKDFKIKPNLRIFNFSYLREMFVYGFFTLANKFSHILSRRVDVIMLSALVGLGSTAVYTIAYFIANVILIPGRGLKQIAAPKVANAFAKNFSGEIRSIYQKSALNQLLAGSFVFLIVWPNVVPILEIINPEYLAAEYVVFFIGLARLVGLGSGIKNQIILHSVYFRSNLVFIFIQLGLVVILNYLLIPKYQIVGAAMGTAIAEISVSISKVVFIWIKLGYQPFSGNMIKLFAIIGVVSVVSYFLPDWSPQNLPDLWANLVTIGYKALVIAALFISGVLLLKPSEDIHEIIMKGKNRILAKLS